MDTAGMRFECRAGCTACCREKGFVYLTEDDLERAARFLGTTPRAFERKYVYRTRNLRRLRVPSQGRCPFLEETGCAIHPAKPTQCRAFPFWPELLDSRREWHKTGKYCPGIGSGPLVQIGEAEAAAGEMRAGYPSLYP
jgi:uncharacterized protein